MKIILLLSIFFIFANCSLNKVVKHHGVNFLEIKNKKLIINQSNVNDITDILGPPITKSSFDENILIYIEKKSSSSKLSKLGKKKLLINNVLILKTNNRGLLISKKLYKKENMNDLVFEKRTTQKIDSRGDQFIYNFLASLRQKINDPLGKKRIKND
tara:strand:+ start:503 stop:973 length:471 start_codon:yes stop_codon:yes gene_type:complete